MAQSKTSQAEFDAKVAVVSDIDWARLAMALGCEGSIFIQRHYKKTGTRRPNYVLTLQIGNTDPFLMTWLCDTFGGNFYSYSNTPNQPVVSRKRLMSWRMFDDRASVLLEKMLPFMIMKRQQAEIALAYREVRKLGSKGRKLTDEDIAIREGFYRQIRTLNSGMTKWTRKLTQKGDELLDTVSQEK